MKNTIAKIKKISEDINESTILIRNESELEANSLRTIHRASGRSIDLSLSTEKPIVVLADLENNKSYKIEVPNTCTWLAFTNCNFENIELDIKSEHIDIDLENLTVKNDVTLKGTKLNINISEKTSISKLQLNIGSKSEISIRDSSVTNSLVINSKETSSLSLEDCNLSQLKFIGGNPFKLSIDFDFQTKWPTRFTYKEAAENFREIFLGMKGDYVNISDNFKALKCLELECNATQKFLRLNGAKWYHQDFLIFKIQRTCSNHGTNWVKPTGFSLFFGIIFYVLIAKLENRDFDILNMTKFIFDITQPVSNHSLPGAVFLHAFWKICYGYFAYNIILGFRKYSRKL